MLQEQVGRSGILCAPSAQQAGSPADRRDDAEKEVASPARGLRHNGNGYSARRGQAAAGDGPSRHPIRRSTSHGPGKGGFYHEPEDTIHIPGQTDLGCFSQALRGDDAVCDGRS